MLLRYYNYLALFLSAINGTSSINTCKTQFLTKVESPLFNATLHYAMLPLVLHISPSTRHHLKEYASEFSQNNSSLSTQLMEKSEKFFDCHDITLEQKKRIFIKHREQITILAKKQIAFYAHSNVFTSTQAAILLQNIFNRLKSTRSLFDQEN